jgi:hypothetical protein
MITVLLHMLRLVPYVFGGHRWLTLENLALRQQLVVYKGAVTGPGFTPLIVFSGPGWPGSGPAGGTPSSR